MTKKQDKVTSFVFLLLFSRISSMGMKKSLTAKKGNGKRRIVLPVRGHVRERRMTRKGVIHATEAVRKGGERRGPQ
ncbi:MAG: hypothetical protein A2Y65_12835 [Deltaproteobacteria bacterium RBG_13_52_11]|nr:MAG: hypothetical protein A2Y65_12835 [Deltaproteobacteria bacterium RBG_13_52_11]